MAGNRKRQYVNYVRKPFAIRGFYAIGLCFIALILFGAVIGLSVKSRGNVPLNVGAMACSSLLFAFFGMVYGVRALFEKEKNYVLAKAAMGIGGFLVLLWLILFSIGIR